MRKLSPNVRTQIVHLLCEGQSIRAVAREIGTSKNAITKLLVETGKACMTSKFRK
ncbi:MAG: helix-turn-helix domain-containing protein [Alphaproteobacteria bacterium]